MILTVDNKQMKLVQLSSTDDINPKGLYLVPNHISFDAFEEEVAKFEEQDDFDSKNTIEAQRIFAYDSIIELDW